MDERQKTDVWAELDRVLLDYDSALKLSVGSGTAWAAELRLTLTDPVDSPSRSVTFYATGHGSAERATRAVLGAVGEWMLTRPQDPMPVPEWMRS